MRIRTASCSCGQLSAEVRGEPIRVSLCHCHACQRRTGSVFGVQTRFMREQVQVRGESSIYIRTGDSGGRAHQSFCPRCGATVFFVLEGHEELIVIPIGAFADNTLPGPVISVYEDRMHPWVQLPTSIEHLS